MGFDCLSAWMVVFSFRVRLPDFDHAIGDCHAFSIHHRADQLYPLALRIRPGYSWCGARARREADIKIWSDGLRRYRDEALPFLISYFLFSKGVFSGPRKHDIEFVIPEPNRAAFQVHFGISKSGAGALSHPGIGLKYRVERKEWIVPGKYICVTIRVANAVPKSEK